LSPIAHANSDLKWNFGANADLQGQYFPSSLSPYVNQAFGILNGEVSATMKEGRGFLVKMRTTGHWDPNNPSPADQAWYDLPEGYMQLKGSVSEGVSGTLQVGYNTFTWGVTDGYNPVDVVSARRYNDPLNSEKLGAFSALGRLDFGPLLLEGIYVPWQRQSTLPGGQSRWLPREIAGPIDQSGVLYSPPVSPQYYYTVPQSLDNALYNNYGARLSAHVVGIDAAAYYFDGAASVPGVGLILEGSVAAINPNTNSVTAINSYPQIGLQPINYRVTVTGGSVVVPVSELILRAELADTKGRQQNYSTLVAHDTEFVGEVEHTFTSESGSLTLIGLVSFASPQYGGNDPGNTSTSTPSLISLFNNAAGLGARWQPSEAVSGEGYAVFDIKHGGSLYKANLGYKLNDNWKIYGGGELFQGEITQPIGVYRKNSRVIAGLHWSI
jgi:hypothetical protein